MGNILWAECKACGLTGNELLLGYGEHAICYREAYCPSCEQVFTAEIENKHYLLHRRRKPVASPPLECPNDISHAAVWLDFGVSQQCPKCKTGVLEIAKIGLWD